VSHTEKKEDGGATLIAINRHQVEESDSMHCVDAWYLSESERQNKSTLRLSSKLSQHSTPQHRAIQRARHEES
jgi:hypothetical protein